MSREEFDIIMFGLFLAYAIFVAGWLWATVLAFRDRVWLGFLCFFVQPAALIWALLNYRKPWRERGLRISADLMLAGLVFMLAMVAGMLLR